MANVTLNLTSQEAEMVLFALTLRSKQKGLHPNAQSEAHALGERFDRAFTAAFGWDASIDRMKLNRRPIKHVSLKCYDLAPVD